MMETTEKTRATDSENSAPPTTSFHEVAPKHTESSYKTSDGASHISDSLTQPGESRPGVNGLTSLPSGTTTPPLPQYLSGARLHTILFGLYFASFLAQLEISVVITALVSITNDLQDYENATWVINSYLLTWSGFLILWSQFGKVLGRRSCLVLAISLFIVFSAACAAAQTMTQLIIFRALQGIGGAGVYNLAIVMICESVPPSRWPRVTAIMSLSVGASFAFGPLIGGAIASSTTWRWVFIINLFLLLLCMMSVPSGFPHHHKPPCERPSFSRVAIRRLDYLGATLFLAFAILLVTALQEASVRYSWNSSVVISLLVLSGVCLLAFIGWQRSIFYKSLAIEPMLSWEFVKRKPLGLLSTALVIGVPYTTAFVQIPQEFQVLDGMSAFEAGKKLIAYALMVPTGIFLGTVLVGRLKLPFTLAVLIGASLQLAATICFAVLPFGQLGSSSVPSRQYGLQIILGIGSGICSSVGTATLPSLVDGKKELMAPLSGANTQFRFTGGAIGLGIITAALNGYVRPRLAAILDADTVRLILESTEAINTLSTEAKLQVLQIYADGFQLQWKIVAGISGLQFLTCLLSM